MDFPLDENEPKAECELSDIDYSLCCKLPTGMEETRTFVFLAGEFSRALSPKEDVPVTELLAILQNTQHVEKNQSRC